MNRFVHDMLMRDRREIRGRGYDRSEYDYPHDGRTYEIRGDYGRMYDGHYPYEYEYDYRYRDGMRDYRRGRYDYDSKENMRLSKKDIDDWKRELENEDGTRGEHYSKAQIQQVLQTMGMNAEEYGGIDTVCMAINMMYSDYCGVAKRFGVDRLDFYANLAKAFLEDKDFDGEPAEKLFLYYKCIVEEDD